MATKLSEKTADAFNRYVLITETRMEDEWGNPNEFLWVDHQPDQRRSAIYALLRHGAIVVQRIETLDDGKRIRIPDGLVHHWIALMFVPGVTLRETVDFQQDYAHHQEIYKPDIQNFKLLSHEGNDYRVYTRLYRKAIVTAVFNANFDIRYFPVDPTREYSRSYSTRIAEVEDAGEPTEHELPVGNDRGYLWRLNTYWTFEEKDGGVYIQLEFIALSRSVPAIFAWLVSPYIKSVPRDYLTHTLAVTRTALMDAKAHRKQGN